MKDNIFKSFKKWAKGMNKIDREEIYKDYE